MKKALKISLFAVVGLALSLAVAGGFLLATCDDNDYARGLVFLVDKLTDYRLELDDFCTVNLSSTPVFSAQSLRIFRHGHPESLSFHNVDIKFFPTALLHGHMKAEVAGLVNERETLTWLLPRELYALNSVDFSGLVAVGASMLTLKNFKVRGRSPRGAVLDLSGKAKISDFSAPQPFSSLDFLIKVASPVSGDFAGYLPDGLPELGPVRGSLRLVDRSPRDLAVKDLKLDFTAGGTMQLHVEGGIARIPVDPEVVNSGVDLDITLKAPQTASLTIFVDRSLPELGPVNISASFLGSKKKSQLNSFVISAGMVDNVRLKVAGQFEFGDFTVGGRIPLQKINLDGSINASAGVVLPVGIEKGWKVPRSGPLAAVFQLHGDGKVIKLEDFSGNIGQSSLTGVLELFLDGKRPKLSGLVTVQTVHLDDFFPHFAVSSATGEKGEADDVLPCGKKTAETLSFWSPPSFYQKPLPLAWLRQCDCDVDVDISVARLLDDAGQSEILHGLDVAMKLDKNDFALDPVSFAYEGGYVKARLLIDDHGIVPKLSFAAVADDLDLVQALRCLGLRSPLTGKVTLDTDLHSQGGTVHELAVNLGGRFEAALEKGRIPTHALALVAVDMLGWSFQRTVMKNKYVDLSCGVLGIQADQGVLTCKALLDAPNMLVTGAGSIDLGNGTCDLVLNPKKKRKFWAVVTPVTIKGPLRDPHVRAIPVTSVAILSGGALLAPQFFLPAIGLNYLWEMVSKDKNGVKGPCFERLRQQ